MGMLDALIYGVRNVFSGGGKLPLRSDINFTGGLQAVDNPTTEALDVSLSSLSGIGALSFGATELFLLTQAPPDGTGSSQGTNASLLAQAGQQQTGSTDNNNGGPIVISGGNPGTGGSGAAAVQGSVVLNGGGQTATVGPTGLSTTGALDLSPITAPSNPATGHFYLYIDNADGKLKALSHAGTVTTLALP